nr:reverse transcriptase domain-containing protein [Tanacetum cinerariifolium]
MMDNEVRVTSPESTTQTLPSFEEYTPPMTYSEEVEKTLGTPIEVEPLNKIKLEEVGLNCNHNTPFSSREVPSFDGPEPQPLLNSPSLDVSLGDVIGPEPPIKPHSLDSSRMKEMFDDDWGLEPKEVSSLGEELSLFDRPNKVERGTVNTGLWYTKDSGFELTIFLDADYAGCKDSFKSTSGRAQFLARAEGISPGTLPLDRVEVLGMIEKGVNPIRLDFKLEGTEVQDHNTAKGIEVVDEDLRKPFKEAQRTLLTCRIIEFAGPEYKMPTNIKLYDDLREAFAARYSVRKGCFKEPYEITKIVRKANESLTAFNERWTVETGFIMGVLERHMQALKFRKGKRARPIAKRLFHSTEGTTGHSGTPILRNHEGMIIEAIKEEETRTLQVEQEMTGPQPLIDETEVEGYLVRRVYVDEESSVEVMFEHCFENLKPRIKARLKKTQTDLVGFVGEISKPLCKIELEVCFGNGGLCRRTSMKFIVVRAPLPYNIILGSPGLKSLRAIPFTIHSMMKYLTPKGLATLVTRTVIIAECRRIEKKQMIEEESSERAKEVAATKEVLVNPSFTDQRVTIRGGLSKACKDQLRCLLKDNIGVFAREPSDMTGVPRWVIEHMLNVNLSLDPVCQKRRTFSAEKGGVVTNEVSEWVKEGIVRPVRCSLDEVCRLTLRVRTEPCVYGSGGRRSVAEPAIMIRGGIGR